MRRDIYEKKEPAMEQYLSMYGWHFNKKLAEWAISKMRDRNGNAIKPKSKDELINELKSFGIEQEKMDGYDAVYVDAMARSDYWGSSIANDTSLCKFIGDYLNDKDGYDGIALTRFYADTIGKGIAIYWEDML